MRKILSIIVCLFVIIAIASCGTNKESYSKPAETKATAAQTTSSQQETLSGEWAMVNGDASLDFSAQIKDNSIELLWLNDETEGLYWKGTFPAEKAKDGDVIKSIADTDALSGSLLGSQAKDKEFTYKNNHLDYKFSVMGVTKTIHLKKK